MEQSTFDAKSVIDRILERSSHRPAINRVIIPKGTKDEWIRKFNQEQDERQPIWASNINGDKGMYYPVRQPLPDIIEVSYRVKVPLYAISLREINPTNGLDAFQFVSTRTYSLSQLDSEWPAIMAMAKESGATAWSKIVDEKEDSIEITLYLQKHR